MVKIEQILCPADFSENSEKTYDYAYSLALHYEAKLFVAYVVPILDHSYPLAAESGLYDDLTERAEEDMKKLLARHAAKGLQIETAVLRGFVPDSLLGVAQNQSADLIVMGTHGRRGFDRLVMGSTAEYVLRKATCPVLAVRKPAHDFVTPDQRPEPVHLHKLMVCTDFSDCAIGATDYALSLAQEYNAELTILHVLEEFPEERKDILIREVHQSLEDLVPQDARNWCRVKTMVRTGKPYREIIQCAEEEQVDLAVLGVRGRNALDIALFGSTTQRMLQLGPCPVLAVHLPAAHESSETDVVEAVGKAPRTGTAGFLQRSQSSEE